MSALSILIQKAIEQRIAPLSAESLNLDGDPYGSDTRYRVQSQHWVSYQGSTYPEGKDSIPAEVGHQQSRELEFQHYVELKDLRRDFQPALEFHERLMSLIAGFRPMIEGVRGPLRLVRDEPVSAKVADEVVYRYRATYRVLCLWVAQPPEYLTPPSDIPLQEIRAGIFRSFVGEVAADSSVKDADAIVEVET